ncbi:MAG: class IV adenylate cyclase [Phycisphaerae bacterium]
MPTELECKIRVNSHKPIRRRLRDAGAEYVGRVREVNSIFDDSAFRLRGRGCGLRVRSITVLDGKGPGATLTYKGPIQASAFKCREELEVTIGDADTASTILEALGFQRRVLFEKQRESWRLGSHHVELDEVPTLGCFVEIEASTEDEIGSVMAQLGLAGESHLARGYVSMLADRRDSGRSEPIEIRFPR